MRHGSDWSYCRHGCRCRPCTEAHRLSTRAWRQRRGPQSVITDTYDAIETSSGWLCIGCWNFFNHRGIAQHERACLYPQHVNNHPTVVAA